MFKAKLKGLILIVMVQLEDKRISTCHSPPNVSTLLHEVKQSHKEQSKDRCLGYSDALGHSTSLFLTISLARNCIPFIMGII